MTYFMVLIKREFRMAFRQSLDTLMVIAFFILAVVLFPFGVGPESNMLSRIGPGVIWVAALLASMLSLERLFQADYEDGSLELLLLQPMALELTVLAKIIVHWMTTGLALVITSPLLAILMAIRTDNISLLMVTLLIATPALSLIGAIGAALVLGSRRGGVLLSLLILPLYIPLLIFAVGALDAAINGLPVQSHLFILGGLTTATLALAPWAGAGALRMAIKN